MNVVPNVKESKTEKEAREIQDIMCRYRSGDAEIRQGAISDMVNKLQNYVRYIIKRNFATYATKYYEDLYQEGIMAVIQGMDKYDPNIARPTTYFHRLILHEMTKYINSMVSKTTAHYAEKITRISKVIDQYEQRGIKWTEQDLSIETGFPLETVAQCMKIKNRTNEVHFENIGIIENDISERNTSPEEIYLENEKLEIIRKALNSLDNEEKEVVSCYIGLSGYMKSSFAETSEKLGIPIDRVKKVYYRSIRKMRTNPYLNRIFRDYLQEDTARTVRSTSIPLVRVAEAESTMDALEEDMRSGA